MKPDCCYTKFLWVIRGWLLAHDVLCIYFRLCVFGAFYRMSQLSFTKFLRIPKIISSFPYHEAVWCFSYWTSLISCLGVLFLNYPNVDSTCFEFNFSFGLDKMYWSLKVPPYILNSLTQAQFIFFPLKMFDFILYKKKNANDDSFIHILLTYLIPNSNIYTPRRKMQNFQTKCSDHHIIVTWNIWSEESF